MPTRFIDHIWILLTVALATYSQLVLKWQMNEIGPLPADFGPKAMALMHALLRPWVLTALFATFMSGVCWMVTLTKFDLSYAFPFTGLNFLVMFCAGVLLFGEQTSVIKFLGTALVVGGVMMIVFSAPAKT
jgi:drug/metabolite transporter (DMT)-like permease